MRVQLINFRSSHSFERSYGCVRLEGDDQDASAEQEAVQRILTPEHVFALPRLR